MARMHVSTSLVNGIRSAQSHFFDIEFGVLSASSSSFNKVCRQFGVLSGKL